MTSREKRSLLLLALFATTLFLFALGASDDGGLHQLLNHALLVLFVLSHHRLPHLVNFTLTGRLSFFLHPKLLFGCLFLEIVLGNSLVFITHLLSFKPFLAPLNIIVLFVASQVVLDLPSLFQAELIETEFKINDGLLIEAFRIEQVAELAADLLIKAVIGHVETEKGLVVDQGLDHFLNASVLFTHSSQVV